MNVMQLLLKRYKRSVNKVIKGGSILSILFALIISLAIPPFNIYAQSLTSPFLGVNVQVTQVDTEYNSLTLPKINIGYLSGTVPSGYISGQLNCTNPSTPTTSQPCDIYQFQNSSGTGGASNGTRIYLNLQQYYLEANGNASFNSAYNYIIDYEFILDDSYKGYVTFNNGNTDKTYYVNGNSFHYSIRQTGLTEIQFTIVDYDLTRVTNPIMWSLPIESLGYNYYLFERYEYEGFTDIDLYSYPMFIVKQNDSVFNYYSVSNKTLTLIFGINETVSGRSQFDNNFSYTGHTFVNGTTLYSYQLLDGSYFCIYKVNLLATGNGSKEIKYIGNKTVKYIGIYAYRNDLAIPNISTEFALRYGLNNRQLNDLDHLANGTVSSNQSSSDLETQKGSFDTTSNDLYTSENAFNTDMNNKLQSIDTSFNPSTSFGSKFLSSADWVRTQFNNLTSTSPFGTVLSFSMLLGLSLLIIGKVFK